MKSLHSLWLALTFIAIQLAASVEAQSAFQVTGYGKVFYTPDRYDLTFAVVTEHAAISQCKQQHLAVLVELKKFLDQQRKSLLTLRQDATTLEHVAKSPNGQVYRFVTTYTARLRDADTLLNFSEGIVSAGATEIRGLDMFSSTQPELQNDARRLAIKDARSKAELAAKELGWKSLAANDISFSEGAIRYWGKIQASSGYGNRASVAHPETPGDLSTYVDCTVTITFQFQQQPLDPL